MMRRSRNIAQAHDDGRVAVLPEWLQEGRTVWWWRQTECLRDLCEDSITATCPLNGMARMPVSSETVQGCARQHPVLEREVIWSVLCIFKPGERLWVVNDLDPVKEVDLDAAFHPSREAAMRRKPREVRRG